MLRVEDINTYIGGSHIIQGLSLYVEKGGAVCILGRNGVGKTTTLRSIIGLTPPQSGKIIIEGEDTTRLPPHKIARKGVAYVPAERHIFPELSVEENLILAARPSEKRGAWTIDRVYEYFPVLSSRRKQEGTTLSGGEQQMLAIGRALMGNPKIMLLDEPSQGLSPLLVKTVVKIVQKLFEEHDLTLLLVEQNFRIALQLAKKHYLMGTKSKIQGVVTSEEILENEEIIHKHLTV
ncbi:MAG: ABC transporter ATP-binding protein [Deltaproteobacteria bacterium]|nr:ABC transporter ATP-binding protein [Deltaproteobacteria bacterium]MBW1929534.1 ABC transporter ATP-binding protein [Deltaproteobacteria bacterium]MBW2024050.1 ABC transporter ATP-binding protein [Deltaproteobacteria bacterium]MBW2124401.1 ABC transporter ATP-binding protein [Deltaproteobacteria bacterium]RLB24572.1 MAG: ABC transporter ATP-binding protein [Deltaproteobacteria bacterium]